MPAKPSRKNPNKVILKKIFEWELSGMGKLLFITLDFNWVH
jgi:hypothetical protein